MLAVRRMCHQDPDSFDRFLTSTAPMFAHLTRSPISPGVPPSRLSPQIDSAAATSVCGQLGLPPGGVSS